MTPPSRARVAAATVVVSVVALLNVACDGSPTTAPSAPASDEITVRRFEDLSGFEIPDTATDVVTEPVPGSSVGALRARFTIPESVVGRFCGTPLPMVRPFTQEERDTFALPDDLTQDEVRDCDTMRPGTNVTRRVIAAPARGEGQVRLYVVAFEMPR